MDGTLTVPVHDFDSMRRELRLPDGVGTLEGLAALSPEEQAARRPLLDEIGWRYVALAQAQDGAEELLTCLSARGDRLGVVTRNGRRNTLGTLEKIGLARFFAPEDVQTRDDGLPKPAPDAVLRLLRAWQALPADGVMVGDAVYDLQAGRAAGASTVLLDPQGTSAWRPLADLCVRDLRELLGILS